MARPKDMQRRKAYAAENAAFSFDPKSRAPTIPDMKDVRAYVQKVTDWARKPDGPMREHKFQCSARLPERVSDGRGKRNATGGASGIALPMWARREWIILHEIAHHCVELENVYAPPLSSRHAAHGWRWAQCYLLLVRRFMGVAAHNALRDAFKAHGVKFRPPRTRKPRELTPEQKMARDMALARAREARAAKRNVAA